MTTVDSDGVVGVNTSIVIGGDGLPVVSYRGGGNLKVAHCGNVTCTAGNTLTTVDSGLGAGSFTSIAVGADGLPVVSYHDSATNDLKVAHCGDPVSCKPTGGTAGWTSDIAGLPVWSSPRAASDAGKD